MVCQTLFNCMVPSTQKLILEIEVASTRKDHHKNIWCPRDWPKQKEEKSIFKIGRTPFASHIISASQITPQVWLNNTSPTLAIVTTRTFSVSDDINKTLISTSSRTEGLESARFYEQNNRKITHGEMNAEQPKNRSSLRQSRLVSIMKINYVRRCPVEGGGPADRLKTSGPETENQSKTFKHPF